jgi:O-antigen/teichoic acid export membrane protein
MIDPARGPSVTGAEEATSAGPWIVRGRKIAGWAAKIAEFGIVQGLVQAVLAIAGLLIARTLPKSEYALFAIANSIQVACNALADLGVGIGVRSIGGRVWNDRKKFGELLHTALGLRQRFGVVAFVVCLPLAAWMFRRNGATIPITIVLCVLIGLAVIPLLGIPVWSTSAQLHGEYRRIQKLDFGNSLVRLALIGVFCFLRLNAILAFTAGVVTNWIQMVFLRCWASEKTEASSGTHAEYRRELIRLSVKTLPNTVFFCLQGQVTLFILTWTGNPSGVADVTALGRVAVLFTVFSVIFSNILGPRFARCQDPKRIRQLYGILLCGTIASVAPLVILASLFPKPFLWLLGNQYSGLEKECVFVVAAACLGHIGTTMWNMNSSKAWIAIQAPGFIPAVVGAQLLAAMFLNLREFHDVLIFNLVSAAAPLPIYAIDAVLGLMRRRST